MATKEMVNRDFAGFRNNVKQEYESKQLTHTCPQCPRRYPNSGMLVQHMNDEHFSFVRQTDAKISRAADKISPSLPEGEKYKNTIATCPYCKHDCQTRKKLMMHLETAHKDDEEALQEEEPRVKVIRLDGSFVTPGATESHDLQKLLKAIGSTGGSIPNGNAKLDNKAPAKHQYKCFWCEASFRKRGKLMDHIDTLHKQKKTQSEEMAEKLSQDDSNKSQSGRSVNHRISQLDVPKFHTGILNAVSAQRSPHPLNNKPVTSSKSGSCSFTFAGSLTGKTKPSTPEQTPPNRCKFYLGKKDNPLANKKVTPRERNVSHADSRRFSLPSMFEDTNSSYNFPYGMLSSNPVTAAMQRNLIMGMRPQLLNATQFYAPRMPAMMMPSSDYLLNHAHPALDQQTTNQHAQQLLARMNAMAHMSPLVNRAKTSSESPLDLTISFL